MKNQDKPLDDEGLTQLMKFFDILIEIDQSTSKTKSGETEQTEV